MNNSSILSYLGFARKAGKLAIGFASSKEACQNGKAFLIVIASDVSQKSEKEIRYFSGGKISVIRFPFSMSEMSNAIGIKAGIVAVLDNGFSDAIIKAENTTDSIQQL